MNYNIKYHCQQHRFFYVIVSSLKHLKRVRFFQRRGNICDRLGLPAKLFAGDDGVVIGERLLVDGRFNFAQQTADAAARARFGSRGPLEAGPVSGFAGAWAFRDHGSGLFAKAKMKKFEKRSLCGSMRVKSIRIV